MASSEAPHGGAMLLCVVFCALLVITKHLMSFPPRARTERNPMNVFRAIVFKIISSFLFALMEIGRAHV